MTKVTDPHSACVGSPPAPSKEDGRKAPTSILRRKVSMGEKLVQVYPPLFRIYKLVSNSPYLASLWIALSEGATTNYGTLGGGIANELSRYRPAEKESRP